MLSCYKSNLVLAISFSCYFCSNFVFLPSLPTYPCLLSRGFFAFVYILKIDLHSSPFPRPLSIFPNSKGLAILISSLKDPFWMGIFVQCFLRTLNLWQVRWKISDCMFPLLLIHWFSLLIFWRFNCYCFYISVLVEPLDFTFLMFLGTMWRSWVKTLIDYKHKCFASLTN